MQGESNRAPSRVAEQVEQALPVMLVVPMFSAGGRCTRWSWRSAITSGLSMASVR
jgi:hypothetical protein